jgi:hypothetical protein
VLTKDALIDAAGKASRMTDNSLEQAISSLRRMLGQPDGAAYTKPGRRAIALPPRCRAERREPLGRSTHCWRLIAPGSKGVPR